MNAEQKKTQEATLKSILWNTWQAVGDEVETSMRQEKQRLTNVIAYEVILDANRAEMYGARTEEEKQVLAEFRKLTWDQQVRRTRKLLGRIA